MSREKMTPPTAAAVAATAPPAGRHIAYWRTHARPDRKTPLPPLEPLSRWETVGLVTVMMLIGALVLFSVLWWAHAIGH